MRNKDARRLAARRRVQRGSRNPRMFAKKAVFCGAVGIFRGNAPGPAPVTMLEWVAVVWTPLVSFFFLAATRCWNFYTAMVNSPLPDWVSLWVHCSGIIAAGMHLYNAFGSVADLLAVVYNVSREIPCTVRALMSWKLGNALRARMSEDCGE